MTKLLASAITLLAAATIAASTHAAPLNVILIMTDDQGYGDFGVTENPVISTPNLDAMAQRGVWMKTFYVSPVCSPTRASLMTGRYNYRTRVVDTYIGRSMMEPAEVTIAEALRDAGYATGIFGKWHLGDNYPLRAMDQGFEESLVLRGGGLGQPSDPPERAGRYTDPILVHNGVLEAATGYCTDIFFSAAIDWIKQSRAAGKPFFAYITPNAPHDPFHDVPEALRAEYAQRDLAQLTVLSPGQSPRRGPEIAVLERIAAMITNVDENVGRLLAALDTEGLSEDTLVIFLGDNGPNTARYVGPFRGTKSDVFEGGVRTPFWMHWPGKLKPGYARDEAVAHIDVMPTILEACGVSAPAGVRLDGRSFWRLAAGDSEEWPARPLVIQSHRGDVPVPRHQFMVREGNWKLLHASGFGREKPTGDPRFELYDVVSDPAEANNLAGGQPDVVQRLLAQYDAWFEDVSHTRPDNYAPPRIHIGTPHENPVTLTRQDWRDGTWADESVGRWLVHATAGTYHVTVRVSTGVQANALKFHVGSAESVRDYNPPVSSPIEFEMDFEEGDTDIQASIAVAGSNRGVHQIDLFRK